MEIDRDEFSEIVKNVHKLNSMQPLISHELKELNKKYESSECRLRKNEKQVTKIVVIGTMLWMIFISCIPIGIYIANRLK